MNIGQIVAEMPLGSGLEMLADPLTAESMTRQDSPFADVLRDMSPQAEAVPVAGRVHQTKGLTVAVPSPVTAQAVVSMVKDSKQLMHMVSDGKMAVVSESGVPERIPAETEHQHSASVMNPQNVDVSVFGAQLVPLLQVTGRMPDQLNADAQRTTPEAVSLAASYAAEAAMMNDAHTVPRILPYDEASTRPLLDKPGHQPVSAMAVPAMIPCDSAGTPETALLSVRAAAKPAATSPLSGELGNTRSTPTAEALKQATDLAPATQPATVAHGSISPPTVTAFKPTSPSAVSNEIVTSATNGDLTSRPPRTAPAVTKSSEPALPAVVTQTISVAGVIGVQPTGLTPVSSDLSVLPVQPDRTKPILEAYFQTSPRPVPVPLPAPAQQTIVAADTYSTVPTVLTTAVTTASTAVSSEHAPIATVAPLASGTSTVSTRPAVPAPVMAAQTSVTVSVPVMQSSTTADTSLPTVSALTVASAAVSPAVPGAAELSGPAISAPVAQPLVHVAAVMPSSNVEKVFQDAGSSRQGAVSQNPVPEHTSVVPSASVKGSANPESGENLSGSDQNAGEENVNGQAHLLLMQRHKADQSVSSAAPITGDLDASLSTESMQHVVQQVKEHLSGREYKTGTEQVSIRLTPENMGELKLNLRMENQHLKVEIVAENSMVRDSLLKHTDALRETLARQNITMESFNVTTDGKGSGSQGQYQSSWDELAKQQQQRQFWKSPQSYRSAQADVPSGQMAYQRPQGHSMLDIHY